MSRALNRGAYGVTWELGPMGWECSALRAGVRCWGWGRTGVEALEDLVEALR